MCVVFQWNKYLQIDYVLGNNPEGRSYMVGFGVNPPTQAHHRGASVPALSSNSVVSCAMSFVNWFNKNGPNFHELTGAIVGGPDRYDNFDDKRWDSSKTEPCTYINSLAIGVLAKLASGAWSMGLYVDHVLYVKQNQHCFFFLFFFFPTPIWRSLQFVLIVNRFFSRCQNFIGCILRPIMNLLL